MKVEKNTKRGFCWKEKTKDTGGNKMPHIVVKLWPGRSDVSVAFEEVAQSDLCVHYTGTTEEQRLL